MRIVIGQTEIEVTGATRLSYDSDSDTLSINPTAHAPAQRRVAVERPLMIAHEPAKPTPEGLTKTVLTRKVLSLVDGAAEPVAIQFITIRCLGMGAPSKHKLFLKLLLDEMVLGGKLRVSMQAGRQRFTLAE